MCVLVRASVRVACAAVLMVRLFSACEYVCVSVIPSPRVHMGSMCACMVTFCLFFSACVCVCLSCMVSLGGLALHLHQLQWMVLTSVMTELGPLIGQILPTRGVPATVVSTLHVSFLLSSLCAILTFASRLFHS